MAKFRFDFLSASDGTRLRYGVFEPEKPARRLCVLANGQSEFIEKYLEVIGELNARGFTVVSFDWRGQGGSTRPLSNPMKGYVADFAAYDDDLASVMAQVVAPMGMPEPLLLAHSMGSHNALRALHDRPDWFRAAVLSAPMLGIATRGRPGWLVRAATAVHAAAGKGKQFAWGMEKREPLTTDFSEQLCTSDTWRFARTQGVLKAHPELRLGGATWGWIEAAYRSMKAMQAPGYAEAIATPVMIVGADKDRVVKTEATRRFAARLPQGRYVEIAEAEHEILMERDDIRAQFWNAFDGFVAGL